MNYSKIGEKLEDILRGYSKEFNYKEERDSDILIFKLQEELGELTQRYIQMTGRGRMRNMTEVEIKEGFKEESVDILVYLMVLFKRYNVNVEKILSKKWKISNEDYSEANCVKEPEVDIDYTPQSKIKVNTNSKKSAFRIMKNLSEESMKKVEDYIRFLKYEEECEATREIMSMPEMVEAIDKYRNNFNESDFVDWDDVKDDV
ncbi:MAG: hypothetical protein A2Y24_07700 [Clostridiales bacterium GWE2_32_10]|nr:MAG: hypothetical protein A2Y24_07700 [Clostridiales bacterium GWE2_32_10]HBY19879.1 hypothetical protein [Clostridiales bacterium]